jgi:hypothetical protein
MQSYLRIVIISLDKRPLGGIDPRMLVSSPTVPILLGYPFLQQYFTIEIKLGALPPVS